MDIDVITKLSNDCGLLLIPLVLAITSMIKGFIPENQIARWSPVISVLAGIGGGLLTIGISKQGVLTGLIIGLSASGLYSGSKSVVNAPKKENITSIP